jgi:plastocyanin
MQFRALIFTCAAALLAAGAGAQSITGTILIKRKLTRPRVTAPVSVYQRGAAVTLGKDAQEDPLVYERSRVVVYLEGPVSSAGDSTAPAAQVQQLDRRFTPDLVVVPVGSTVTFPNMDPIFHNIYSLSKPRTFDLGSYDKGQTRKVAFPKPGIVDVYCHLHPNMAATIVVTPNRWYARPDDTGKYTIPDVPPGQYTIVAWHKSVGFFRKPIVVETGHDSVADFFIPLDVDTKQDAETNQNPAHAGGSQ